MYISDIFIKNFQSHQETYLSLCNGVNIFTGSTGAGKSAIFRALIWLFTNKPSGDEFRSHWGGTTEVSVCLQPENVWLGRVRSKTDNYYWINDDMPDERFSGFGSGPPPQNILSLLNLGDVNFQAQMTLPFLLSLGAAKVGKFFNESADLQIIDKAYSYIDKAEYSDRATKKEAETLTKSKRSQLKEFGWLAKAEKQLIVCEQTDIEIKKETNKAHRLQQLALEIRAIETQNFKIKNFLKAESLIDSCVGLRQELLDLQRKRREIDSIRMAVLQAQEDAVDLKNEIIRLENEYQENFPDECPLCEAPKDWYNK